MSRDAVLGDADAIRAAHPGIKEKEVTERLGISGRRLRGVISRAG